jgi:hypothetical protein
MDIEQTTETQGDRPAWLGSVARRLEQTGAQAPSAAEAAPASDSTAWTGSSERSALFTKPVSAPEPIPVPVAVAVAPANLHALPPTERIVMGALGMTLRVAA